MRILYLWIIPVLCFPLGAGASIESTSFLSYPDAAKEMLENNPDLATVRSQEESLKFKSIQAISPNEPVFSVTKTDVPNPSILSEGGGTVYGVSWTLGFPGKALSQSHNLEHQALALKEVSFQKEIELLTTLSNVYVELSVNQSTIETLKEELKRAGQTVMLTQKRYSSAQAPQTDILNAKFYKTSIEHDILTQEATRDALTIQFRTLLRRPEDFIAPKISEDWENQTLTPSFIELKNYMFRNRPQLKSVVYQKNAASSALTNASLALFPDFQFTANMNNYHVTGANPVPGLMKSYTVGIGIAIPIFFPFNELSGIRSAKMDFNAAEFIEESARVNLISELQNLFTKFESSKRLYKNTLDYVIPAAKANYTLSLKSFEVGRLDYLKLLDARKSWIQSQRDLLDRKKELAELINQITLEVGCDWNKKGVPHACE